MPVGGPGDNGIDVVLLDVANPLILEVRRSADPASGQSVRVVTELLGMAWRSGRCEGIVVSTADRYRFPDQHKALRGTSVMNMGHRIQMYDAATVVDVLARTLTPTERPWETFLRRTVGKRPQRVADTHRGVNRPRRAFTIAPRSERMPIRGARGPGG